MNLAALYHRPDSEMAYLKTPTVFQIRLRTAKADVSKVSLYYGDPYGNKVNEKDESQWEYQEVAMTKLGTSELYDYWQAEVSLPLKRLQYLFAIDFKDGQSYFYDDRHVWPATKKHLLASTCFRMPYFHEVDRKKAPAWVKDTVWYQIFPERFANGDKSNDPKGTLAWGSVPPSRTNYFGGDLQGVIDHLDYLKELGIGGIYFCPLFTAGSNHKYDTIDYFNIDPAFGDKAKFKELVDEAHKRGIKIMLDAVFNHMGDFAMQWQDVVKYGQNSRFSDWFHINSFPVSYEEDGLEHAKNISYDVFANTPHMPKLNTANPEVKAYLLEIATYWIKQFDIDAWRLDVANEVDHHFWKAFYEATHALKPDFYVVGEVWHSAQEWLAQEEFDAIMNYPFTEAILDGVILKKTKPKEMLAALLDNLMKYRDQTNQVMLNSLDTHDTARILTLAKGKQDLVKQALALMFVLPGSPCLYYGTEVGMAGGNDPACRACMVWDQTKQDLEMLAFTKELIALRKRYASYLNQVPSWSEQAGLVTLNLGQKLQASFNLSPKAVAYPKVSQPLLANGLSDKQLKAGGFVISLADWIFWLNQFC